MERLRQLQWRESIIVAVVLTAFYYFALYDNGDKLVRQIKATKETIQTKRGELNKINKAKQEKEQTVQEMSLISDQFQRVLQYLPTDLNASDLMRTIWEEARAAGTRNLKIHPENHSEHGLFYEPLYIKVELEGKFVQVASLLSSLTKVPRLINVTSIDLKLAPNQKHSDSQLLSFKGTLVGYRYSEQKEKDKSKQENKNAK